MENRVQKLVSSILDTSIKSAIKQKGSKVKEQREVNTAIDALRNQTQEVEPFGSKHFKCVGPSDHI